MLKRSNIGWCDYSAGDLNVAIRGQNCPVSEGCANCYVARDFARYDREMTEGTTIYPDKLGRLWKAKFEAGDQPYRRGPGSKPIMFVADYGDLFCEDVPDHFIFEVLDMCDRRGGADWVLLTKRPERMLKVTNDWLSNWIDLERETSILPSNIWCLVTAENQDRADERIPVLLQVKARVHGISIEPMLGPVTLEHYLGIFTDGSSYSPHQILRIGISPIPNLFTCLARPRGSVLYKKQLDWIIVGAESGPHRRPFEAAWAEDVYRQCQAAGVPFFGKQDSGLRPGVPLLIEDREIKEFPKCPES